MQNRAIYKLAFTGLVIFLLFMGLGVVFGHVVSDLLASFTGGGRVRIEGESISITPPPCGGSRGKLTSSGTIECKERDGAIIRTFGLAGAAYQTIPVRPADFEAWCRQQKVLVNRAKASDFDLALPEDLLIDGIDYIQDPLGLTVVAEGKLLQKRATLVVSWILIKERICRFTLLQVSEQDRRSQFPPPPALAQWRGEVLAANAK